MTNMGLQYLQTLETTKHNRATEFQAANELAETTRSHKENEKIGWAGKVIEQQNADSNRITAKASYSQAQTAKYRAKTERKQFKEGRRHNKATEKIQSRANDIKYVLGDREIIEKTRHNKASEGLSAADIAMKGNIAALNAKAKLKAASIGAKASTDVAKINVKGNKFVTGMQNENKQLLKLMDRTSMLKGKALDKQIAESVQSMKSATAKDVARIDAATKTRVALMTKQMESIIKSRDNDTSKQNAFVGLLGDLAKVAPALVAALA